MYTWVTDSSFCSVGFRRVYDYWVLGPLELWLSVKGFRGLGCIGFRVRVAVGGSTV